MEKINFCIEKILKVNEAAAKSDNKTHESDSKNNKEICDYTKEFLKESIFLLEEQLSELKKTKENLITQLNNKNKIKQIPKEVPCYCHNINDILQEIYSFKCNNLYCFLSFIKLIKLKIKLDKESYIV